MRWCRLAHNAARPVTGELASACTPRLPSVNWRRHRYMKRVEIKNQNNTTHVSSGKTVTS